MAAKKTGKKSATKDAVTKSVAVAESAPLTKTSVLAYKGFDKNLQCKDFQYVVGQSYTHTGALLMCQSGFHACENPLDVWSYYGPFESRFALVELSGTVQRKENDDSKVCAASLHMKAELKLPEFINAAVQWIMDACKGSSGDKVQSASGASSRLAASGDSSQLAASGFYSRLAASGDSSQLAASGFYSRLAASGFYSQLAASGASSQLAASGASSRLAADGKDSVIASSAINATAKGVDGTWISLAEFDANNRCTGFAVGCVGKDGIPADKWLKASNGKLVEVA
jgi:hypothetical protein